MAWTSYHTSDNNYSWLYSCGVSTFSNNYFVQSRWDSLGTQRAIQIGENNFFVLNWIMICIHKFYTNTVSTHWEQSEKFLEWHYKTKAILIFFLKCKMFSRKNFFRCGMRWKSQVINQEIDGLSSKLYLNSHSFLIANTLLWEDALSSERLIFLLKPSILPYILTSLPSHPSSERLMNQEIIALFHKSYWLRSLTKYRHQHTN